jgi:hypothetical protein
MENNDPTVVIIIAIGFLIAKVVCFIMDGQDN